MDVMFVLALLLGKMFSSLMIYKKTIKAFGNLPLYVALACYCKVKLSMQNGMDAE